ncbi:hypothetical protein CBL_05020 [Carabus blaptoides fortunei]
MRRHTVTFTIDEYPALTLGQKYTHTYISAAIHARIYTHWSDAVCDGTGEWGKGLRSEDFKLILNRFLTQTKDVEVDCSE